MDATSAAPKLARHLWAALNRELRPAVWVLLTILTPIVAARIAVPLMLGSHPHHYDKSAQSALKVTLTNAKAMFGDTGSYQSATASGLAELEPGYSFVDQHTEATMPHNASVAATKATFVAAAKSKTGRCFFIFDSETSGTKFAETKDRPCAAAEAPGPASALWAAAWRLPTTT
jgi:hypothetical protein